MNILFRFMVLIFVANLQRCIAWTKLTTSNKIKIKFDAEQTLPLGLKYSRYQSIELQKPKFDILTSEMQSNISHMTEILTDSGFIGEFELKANFKKVTIQRCDTSEVVINPSWEYQTEELKIVFNKLENLPQHLNVLKKLKILALNNNDLDFIEMNEFNGLDKLESISLGGNQIYEIRATMHHPVTLPKLEKFHADGNRINYINFMHWNTPALKEIKLNENQLQIALYMLKQFPALKLVNIHSNPLNCKWFKTFSNELKVRGTTMTDAHQTTCKETGETFHSLIEKIKLEQISPLPRQFKKLSTEVRQLRKESMNLAAINEDLKANIQRLTTENGSLKSGQKSTNDQLDSVLSKVKVLEEKVKELSNSLDSQVTIVDRLKNENRDLQNDLNKNNASALRMEQQLQTSMNSLEKSIKTKLESMQDVALTKENNFSSKIEQLHRLFENTSQESKFLRNDSINLRKELENYTDDVRKQITGMIANKDKEINDLLKNLNTSNKNDFELMKNFTNNLYADLVKAQEEQKSSLSEQQAFQKENKDLRNNLLTATGKIQKLDLHLNKLPDNSTIAVLSSELKVLQQLLCGILYQ